MLDIALSYCLYKHSLLSVDQSTKFQDLLKHHRIATVDQAKAFFADRSLVTPRLAQAATVLLPDASIPEVSGYRLLANLSRSGKGRAWLADDGGRKLVVVKLQGAGPQLAADDKRFEREAGVLVTLDHPNVVRSLASGWTELRRRYLVTEFVPGIDFRQLVVKHHHLAVDMALGLVIDVAKGLAAAHELRLLHRDVRPDNIYLAMGAGPKLGDFGLARSTDSDRVALTIPGQILGDPAFMSPEQLTGAIDIDERSDLYAIGALLFFALSGTSPFHGSVPEVMEQRNHDPHPSLATRIATVPEGVVALVSRCMEPDRERRFPTIHGLLAALDLERTRVATATAQPAAGRRA